MANIVNTECPHCGEKLISIRTLTATFGEAVKQQGIGDYDLAEMEEVAAKAQGMKPSNDGDSFLCGECEEKINNSYFVNP